MTDPATIAGYKLGTLVGMGSGATAAALLMNGPIRVRLIAGAVGGVFSYVGTPLFVPLVHETFKWIYALVGADISRIEVDSVAGFTGFVLALCGIDFCRWIIERTKFGLSIMRIPWPWTKGGPPPTNCT
jgi:hypothetical protein